MQPEFLLTFAVIISVDSLSKSPKCLYFCHLLFKQLGFSPKDIQYLFLLTAILISLFLQHITVILGLHPVLHHMLSSLWLLYICRPDKLKEPIHPLVKARSKRPRQAARVTSTTHWPAYLKASGKPALPSSCIACQAHRHNQHFWFMLLTIYLPCDPC